MNTKWSYIAIVVVLVAAVALATTLYVVQSSRASYASEVAVFTTEQEYQGFQNALLADGVHILDKEVLHREPPVAVVRFKVRVPANMEFPYGERSQDKGAAALGGLALILLVPIWLLREEQQCTSQSSTSQ